MTKSLTALMTWLERLLGVLLIASVVLNFGNVIARYLFGTVLLSADEIQIFGLVVMTFLGAAIVTWRGQHLRMDVLRPLMPPRLAAGVRWLEAVIAIVVIGFVCFQSWRYVVRVWSFGQVSDMAHVPMWIPHSAVLIGFALVAVMLIVRIFSKAPPQDVSEADAAKDQRI
jgi:TRAP-type C4-dicarboxylate transport system permease small subunit